MVEVYPVATQIGTFFACRCLTKRLAPMIDENGTEGYQYINMIVVTQLVHLSIYIATKSIEFDGLTIYTTIYSVLAPTPSKY